jgi:tRNA(Ile)-lysidine synthase
MLKTELSKLRETVFNLDAKKAAIAFSGGGDSTALLHMLRDHPNVSHAFIIDHNLRTTSESETQQAAEYARSLGYQVKTRKWVHSDPKTGIQVKARAYRYAAMGDMAREEGVTHLLTAHTADDQVETLLMRQDRLTGWRGLAGMRAEAYGPLWPALADVTLVRPLLGVSRANLRDYNMSHGLSWVEDPSNENLDFTRIRARQKLSNDPAMREALLTRQGEMSERLADERAELCLWMRDYAVLDPHGFIRLSNIPPSELFLHLLRVASGSGGPIDSSRRDALLETMKKPDFKAATLAGAWVIKEQDGFLITRDKVAALGRGHEKADALASMSVRPHVPFIWDGRFRINAQQSNFTVQPAFGILQKLREVTETIALFNLPQHVRATQPIFLKDGHIIGFGAGEWDGLESVSLAGRRLQALWG